MRLWLLDEVQDIRMATKGLIRVLVERADNEKDYLLPGYTHLQVGCELLKSNLLSLIENSVDNQYGGRTSCYPTHRS